MPLTSKREVRNLLKKYVLRPNRRLGQHFLVDRGVLRDIIAAAEVSENDVVLEIGPGIGTLTQEIAARVKKVIAVEKDEKMIEILLETLVGRKNIEILHDDILKINLKSLILNLKSYKVVANLPYYIVSPVIRKFLEAKNPPQEMVLMVQKEVAQRICARPPKMNLLAVSVQFYAEPKIVRYVKKTSFWPQPKVDSAIIRIRRFTQMRKQIYADGKMDSRRFFGIVRTGFAQPRKQLINNLSRGLKMDKLKLETILRESGIDPTARAENLSIKNWVVLTKMLKLKRNV